VSCKQLGEKKTNTEKRNAVTRQNVGSKGIKKMERNRGQIKEGEITLGRETLKLSFSPSKMSSISEFTTFSIPF
jgi:hypothetical protein